MVIDISLFVLNGDRPLIIEARREKDTTIRQEEPVGIGHCHVDFPPCAIVTCPFIAEHGATLSTNLSNVHRLVLRVAPCSAMNGHVTIAHGGKSTWQCPMPTGSSWRIVVSFSLLASMISGRSPFSTNRLISITIYTSSNNLCKN